MGPNENCIVLQSLLKKYVPDDGRPSQQVENHRRACTQVPFLRKSRDFFTFRNSDRMEIPVRPGWYLPLQKIPLLKIQMKNLRSVLGKTKSHLRGDAKD